MTKQIACKQLIDQEYSLLEAPNVPKLLRKPTV